MQKNEHHEGSRSSDTGHEDNGGDRCRKAMQDSSKPEMVTKTMFKEIYHLSNSLIRQLGDPDEEKINPHRRNGPTMKLYKKIRVDESISQNAALLQDKAAVRHQQSIKSAEIQAKKRLEIIQRANSTVVKIHKKIPVDIMNAAQNYFDNYALEKEASCSEGRVNLRGVLAYLRHQRSSYGKILERYRGLTGRDDACVIIKRKAITACINKLHELYGDEFFLERRRDHASVNARHEGEVAMLAGDGHELDDLFSLYEPDPLNPSGQHPESVALAIAFKIIGKSNLNDEDNT